MAFKPKSMKTTKIDKTIFRNPCFYSACSPGSFVLLSIICNIIASLLAGGMWCYSAQFHQLVLHEGVDKTGMLFQNLPELKESAEGWGCIVTDEGFDYIHIRLDEAFALSVKEKLNPIKKNETQKQWYFAKNIEQRDDFYIAWLNHIVTELLSVLLGMVFLLLALFNPLRRCKGAKCESRALASIAAIKNVSTLIGLIHYGWGYSNLDAFNKLELQFIINSRAIFWASLGYGIVALLFSFVGAIMTTIKGRYDQELRGEGEHVAKPRFADIKDQLKNIGVTKGGGGRKNPPQFGKTRNYDVNRERLGNNDNEKPRYVHDDGESGPTDLQHLGRDLKIKGREKTIAKNEYHNQADRYKGGRNNRQNEENLAKDFRGSGRNSRSYALFLKNEEWLTEVEAKKVDWSRYHRRAGPRGPDGRIKIYYAKPSPY